MANILITGGAGYVGSHVLMPLIKHGHQPIVVDNFSRGHRSIRELDKRIKVVETELSDHTNISKTLEDYQIDAVMHFAALAYVEESNKVPDLYYINNTVETLWLAKALINYRKKGPPPIVFSSSCAVFGNPESLPINEDTVKKPISPYGRSKLAAEWILEDFGRAYGLSSVILRYFNASGADLENGTGENHEPETHLIPLAIRAARKQKEIRINGNDYPTKDGTAVRDYIHVKDLATAHIAALNYLLAGGESNDFNLGNGEGHSILEVIHAIERITATKMRVKQVARRLGDPGALVCDASKAREILKWQPEFSALEGIISDSAAWDAKQTCIEVETRG